MAQGFLQIAIFCAVLVAIMPLLGNYMARLFSREEPARAEAVVYKTLGISARGQQDWKAYAKSVIAFSAVGWLLLFVILRAQSDAGAWDLSFNTASSFVTNTNWQYYAGETTLTNFSQMFGLTVQNFVSASVGIAVAVALIRAIGRRRSSDGDGTIGNFWVDLTRACLYVLLPISAIAGLLLASRGVVQDWGMTIASQEAIKELGTNGGGYFNVNSAFPWENPTGFTNFLEMVLMLSIPVSLTWTYGRLVGNRREGLAIFAAMAVIFIVGVVVVYAAEHHGTPALSAAGLDAPNMEGKEVRNGIAGSSLWAAVTTVTSTGAVNAAMESLTGFGSLVPFANMSMSETVFGGVGTGLYSMLLFVLLAVFIGGLMVGRTPEYLGKKVEAREIKLVALGTLFTPITVLIAAGVALGTKYGGPSISSSSPPQGFSETLYAYLSQGNNNGSAFAGYTGVTFADLLGGSVMIVARFAPILIVLAIAGSLASKRTAPIGAGTLRTDSPTFVGAARQRRRDRRRPDVLSRPAPRPDLPGPDRQVVLTCASSAPQRSRSSS